jgi:glycyl-tRNA synthetase beta chain
MTWIPGNKFSWPRPIRHILALLDDKVIKFDFHGIPVDRITRGHPFHGKRKIKIENADIKEFESILEKELVILDFEKRKKMIRKLIDKEFKKESAVFTDKLDDLLDEVANLVEYPDVIVGEFDKEFLSLPKEIIQAAMMEHQRYFPMEKEDGTLINKFVTISNRPKRKKETKKKFDKVRATIRAGNERVIRARLADAKFFFEDDCKRPLESYFQDLAGMVYHAKLGSNLEKANRLVRLVSEIGPLLEYDEKVIESARRAAYLCRIDLVTGMVGEFPSLQGIVGKIYAGLDGAEDEVAAAIAEYYWPRYSGEELKAGAAGELLLIADKLDSLVGFFAIGEEPKGNQDPYALRRAAIALVTILIEKRHTIAPGAMLVEACNSYINMLEFDPAGLIQNILRFMKDRFYVNYTGQGYPADHVRSVLEDGVRYPLYMLPIKLDALKKLHDEPGWFDLVKSVQRCRPGKIAKDLEEKGLDVTAPPKPEKFTEDGERTIFGIFEEVRIDFLLLIGKDEYVKAGELFLRRFKDPINDFFDNVFINVEDEEIRLNRLRLTGAIYELFAENFADMAEIAGPEKTSEQ